MHKCIVCFNTYNNTKVNRPGVIYHRIPKNKYIRRKWLKVFGIDHCHDWQRICSDHFLKENYKPGKKRFLLPNTTPQPYDRNRFPSNYATQSNDVETGNNVILPMEQIIIKEEHIGNAVLNNFKSPRRSSRIITNNEDMSNKNMPDLTLGSGLRCSVKNCFNRLSKNLSLFYYPKDFKLRKKWIKKCGIKKNSAKRAIIGTRVCSTHFELDCFKNTELKNRLKPGAVPSLFLDNVSIDEAPVLITCEDRFISSIDSYASRTLAKDRVFQRINAIYEANEKTIQRLTNTIAETKEIVLKLRRTMAEDKRNRQHRLALKPSGILNIMKP